MRSNAFFYDLLITLLIMSCSHSPTVSPGQGSLYYCSRLLPSGPWQVYKKDRSTAKVDTITANAAYNYWWVEPSPDHTQLIMMRSPYGRSPDQYNYTTCEMVKANADGTNQRVLLADDAFGWYAFGNPHWHPGGNRILLIAQPGNASTPFYAATVDTNGSNPSLLTTQYSLDANWSPSGHKIVFIGIGSSGTVPLNFEVFTADYNYPANQVSSIKQLTNDTTRDQDPCFSPDGTAIAFSAGNATYTNADLVTIDTAGANRTTILDDNGIHGGPLNWGSDGNVYYHSIYLGLTSFTVNRINVATRQTTTLLSSPAYGYISPFYSAP